MKLLTSRIAVRLAITLSVLFVVEVFFLLFLLDSIQADTPLSTEAERPFQLPFAEPPGPDT